jgi:hypothetical protein
MHGRVGWNVGEQGELKDAESKSFLNGFLAGAQRLGDKWLHEGIESCPPAQHTVGELRG